MDMIEVLADASRSSNVAYHDFLLYYKQNNLMVYGFVEGNDDPSFYQGFIDANLPDEWECKLIPSGNKKKVLEVFAAMDWSRFPKKAICFFIDRDFSEFLDNERPLCGHNLFTTEHYSIENQIVNYRTLERTLIETCRVGAILPTEKNKLQILFDTNKAYFSECLACIMAQIIIWRRLEAQRATTTIVRLDNIKPINFFVFINGELKLKEEFISPLARLKHASEAVRTPMSTDLELKAVEDEFRAASGIAKFIRGKYILQFFIESIKAFRNALPSISSRFTGPPGVGLGFGAETAMMVVGPRVRCPESLNEFLKLNYGAYVDEIEAQRNAGS